MDRYYKKRFVPLALPALILFVMVIVIPFIMGVIYSFTAWRGTYFAGGDHFWEAFVGFDNYVKAFKTKKFLDAFVYTIKVTLVAVVAINVVSLAMALLATSLNKGAAAYRTISSVVSPVRCNFSYPLKNETLIPIFRQPVQSESSWSPKSASDLPSTISPAFWKERSLPR